MNKKIEGTYKPKDFEDKLYKEWEEKGYFKPSMDKKAKKYSIVMPPPNVTGKLHMGHALDDTIQDVLIRAKRMQGYNTLWLPGTDHAAIATEVKVVAKMKEEGLTKEMIGREKFLERAWDWTHLYGGTIQEQQRKLGCSCDWERNRFTLDEGLSEAVLEQFVSLYKEGLIYKGKRMINWCPTCHTSISDAEVEYVNEDSHLWHLRYKVVKEPNEKDIPDYVEVATTRPETMLGDTAVAVNPKDKRYKKLVGRKCIVPIVDREVPIIADEFVELEFGTGCVKITPAHDPNDYEAGQRHDLEVIEVFDDRNIMGNLDPDFEGMLAIDCRQPIVDKLDKLGAIVSIEDYNHDVGTCYRCHQNIEPRISDQWFVAMKKLAEPAIKAVEDGDIKFVPKKYEKMYFNWMRNIRDWCISRQLWWGHRIPAYYCDKCGHINVSKTEPEKCEECGSKKLTQDEDTLDTWFSSALWPFSTMGWPNKEAEDYKMFYPTDCLVTGYDIITFWVSRMIFSGIKCTDEFPFKDIVIHGLVRDSQGRKMSKSLGNGIDPLEIVEQYGADSLRFSLLSGTTMGNDIKYMPEKLDQASNFANKIWNAAKFVNMNRTNEEDVAAFEEKLLAGNKEAINKLSSYDKWMLGKLNVLIKEISKNIDHYDLGVAVDKLYSFIWDEYCDWYIEMNKTRFQSGTLEEKTIASFMCDYALRVLMKLLHPFMPFVTSKIYESLVYNDDKELMVSDWPKVLKIDAKQDIEFIDNMKAIIVQIRNIRTNMNVHPSKKAELIFVTDKYQELIEVNQDFIARLGFGKSVTVQKNKKGIDSNAVSIAGNDINLYMPFDELVDIEEERERLKKEKEKLEAELERSKKILSNKGFIAKAPKEKIDEEKAKQEKYSTMLEEVNSRLKCLK